MQCFSPKCVVSFSAPKVEILNVEVLNYIAVTLLTLRSATVEALKLGSS
jgi:hypothetical protein